MRAVTEPAAAAETSVRMPTRRALAKQRTRSRVLAAARKLFGEHGYDGATIRDIAAAADMSTGAVFANFADKSDLFREILAADVVHVIDAMAAADAEGADVDDSLVRMYVAGYAYYQAQLPLARAAFMASWGPPGVGGVNFRGAYADDMSDLFRRQLDAAVLRGELRQDGQTLLRGQILFDCYLSNYSHIIYFGMDPEALSQRSRAQVEVVLAGVRPY
jgi:AcrR family transcriptional regulator